MRCTALTRPAVVLVSLMGTGRTTWLDMDRLTVRSNNKIALYYILRSSFVESISVQKNCSFFFSRWHQIIESSDMLCNLFFFRVLEFFLKSMRKEHEGEIYQIDRLRVASVVELCCYQIIDNYNRKERKKNWEENEGSLIMNSSERHWWVDINLVGIFCCLLSVVVDVILSAVAAVRFVGVGDVQ